MPLDFEEEGRRTEDELHWAIQQEDTVNRESRRALREIDENRKSISAEMDNLEQQEEQLLGIIEGKIKPSAVDLPQEEAQDFKTKLRLRVKGVRGIAIEKARNDLVPIEERIEALRTRTKGLDSKAEALESATAKALELGNPILANIMMIGAAAGIGALPLDREDFETAISQTLSADKLELNLKAYDLGVCMVQ